MAVYTPVSSQDIEVLLQKYSIGTFVGYEGISSGVENTNYILETSLGRYVLTIFEKRVTSEDLPFFIHLKDYMGKEGLPVPQPIFDKNGCAIQQLQGKPAAIFSFLNGREVDDIDVNACEQVGEFLAQFHLAMADAPFERENTLSCKQWSNLLRSCSEGSTVALLEKESVLLSEQWPEELPRGIIHADLFSDNVLFENGRISGVLDFYFSCTDYLAYDLAICLTAWCFDGQNHFNAKLARSMISAYSAVRPLSALEIEAMPVLLRGSAVRFTITRLIDYNNNIALNCAQKSPDDILQRLDFYREYAANLDVWAAQ